MEKEYGGMGRADALNAAEWAAERLMRRIDFYMELHETAPSEIVLLAQRYNYDYCASLLRTALDKRGLRPVISSSNGNPGSLVFDLDQICDEFFRQPGLLE